MEQIKVRNIGNSVGIILPKEFWSAEFSNLSK
jgi:antitoxin component of MazEF toxin-antitoxin module